MAAEQERRSTRLSAERPDAQRDNPEQEALQAERLQLVERLTELTDGPLTLLAFVMLGLLVAEFAGWLPDWGVVWAERIQLGIWAVFTLDFAVRLVVAPDRLRFLRRNWLGAISVILPAFRTLRVLRVARVLRSVRLLRLLTIVNRSLRNAATSLGGRTFPYFVLATAIVVVAGAAGMLGVERNTAAPLVRNFGDALWWSTTIVAASELGERPATLEGRVIALGLSIWGTIVFGYITATLASHFIGARAREENEAAAARSADLERKLDALREEIERLRTRGVSREGE